MSLDNIIRLIDAAARAASTAGGGSGPLATAQVMEGVGPNNAREYTRILGGMGKAAENLAAASESSRGELEEAIHRLTEAIRGGQRPPRVSEILAGQSRQEQWAWMQERGAILSQQEVSERVMNPRPTKLQILAESKRSLQSLWDTVISAAVGGAVGGGLGGGQGATTGAGGGQEPPGRAPDIGPGGEWLPGKQPGPGASLSGLEPYSAGGATTGPGSSESEMDPGGGWKPWVKRRRELRGWVYNEAIGQKARKLATSAAEALGFSPQAAGALGGRVAGAVGALTSPVGLALAAGYGIKQLGDAANAAAAKIKAPESWEELQEQVEGLAIGLAESVPIVGGFAAAAVRLTIAVAKAPFQLERFAESVLDSSTHLRRYNAAINDVFLRLEYQQRVLAARTAQATGGSAELLGSGLQRLRQDLQPFREAANTIKNLTAWAGTLSARALAEIAKTSATVRTVLDVLKLMERHVAGQKESATSAWKEHFRAIAQGNFGQPRNRTPERHHRPRR